jgi:hypothetical protein
MFQALSVFSIAMKPSNNVSFKRFPGKLRGTNLWTQMLLKLYALVETKFLAIIIKSYEY